MFPGPLLLVTAFLTSHAHHSHILPSLLSLCFLECKFHKDKTFVVNKSLAYPQRLGHYLECSKCSIIIHAMNCNYINLHKIRI